MGVDKRTITKCCSDQGVTAGSRMDIIGMHMYLSQKCLVDLGVVSPEFPWAIKALFQLVRW